MSNYKRPSKVQFTSQQETVIAASMEVWRTDIVAFADELFRIKLTPKQIEIVTAFRDNKLITIRGGAGFGKTMSMAILLWWAIITFDEVQVTVFGPNEAQLKGAFWNEVLSLHTRMDPIIADFYEATATKVERKNASANCFAEFRLANKDNPAGARGIHKRNNFLIVDEATGVDRDLFTDAFMNVMSDPNPKLCLVSNPDKIDSFFYDTFYDENVSPNWVKIHGTMRDGPFMTDAKYEEIAHNYGGVTSRKYRVMALGEFPTSDTDSLISKELIEAAVNRMYDEVGELAGNTPVNGAAVKEHLAKISTRFDKAGTSEKLNLGKTYEGVLGQARAIVDDINKGASFTTVKEARTSINALARDAGTPAEKRMYEELSSALTRDMEDAAIRSGDDVLAKWKAADARYQRVMSDDDVISRRAMGEILNKESTESIYNLVQSSTKNSTAKITRILEQVKAGGGEAAAQEVFRGVFGRLGMNNKGVFSASTLVRDWNKMAPEARDAFMNVAGGSQLKNQMNRLAKAFAEFDAYQTQRGSFTQGLARTVGANVERSVGKLGTVGAVAHMAGAQVGRVVSSTGMIVTSTGAQYEWTGCFKLHRFPNSNIWIGEHTLGYTTEGLSANGGGEVTLDGALTNIRLLPNSGNFDKGSVQVRYR